MQLRARPIILAVLLAMAAFGGLINGYKILTGSAWGSRIGAVFAISSGIAALVAAIGIWHERRWGYTAYQAWAAIMLALGVSFVPYFHPLFAGAMLAFFAFTLWALGRQVQRAQRVAL